MGNPVNVLVVFYSRYGETERLALAAGLGAIQEEANIRLRRLADRAPPRYSRTFCWWGRGMKVMPPPPPVPGCHPRP